MKLNRIKAVLSEKGISQTWLAKKLDKSFSMVNAYACNRIQPNLETLQRIAEILQVDLKDLITDKKRDSNRINRSDGFGFSCNL
ncbi:helix-turn-helix domain-containing protein [Bacteroides faecichinchillae]|uniref:helix-turn-helix domain-containing protein n=1 Tax=Bacteroides faecichinchillae TaxID=871325 RepID=UPI00046A9B03|nr:helix-turn-helix transcriptional regulator [Bacteroides faecichinchillae]